MSENDVLEVAREIRCLVRNGCEGNDTRLGPYITGAELLEWAARLEASRLESLAEQGEQPAPAEVWVVSGPGVRTTVFAHEPTREDAPEDMVNVQRVPVHGAPQGSTARECGDPATVRTGREVQITGPGLLYDGETIRASCHKREHREEALHEAIEECHDALERKQNQLDVARATTGEFRRATLDNAVKAARYLRACKRMHREWRRAWGCVETAQNRWGKAAAECDIARARVEELEEAGSAGVVAFDIQHARADRLEAANAALIRERDGAFAELAAARAEVERLRKGIDHALGTAAGPAAALLRALLDGGGK